VSDAHKQQLLVNLRPHVVVFIEGRRASDRETLSDALGPDDKVYVLQALTGG